PFVRVSRQAADGNVHPEKRCHDDDEQQHEAARPKPSDLVQEAECYGKNEAAQSADHADQSADRTDVRRIVGCDMLEDRRFTEAHEEAEYEGDTNEYEWPDFKVRENWTAGAVHHVVGRRQ